MGNTTQYFKRIQNGVEDCSWIATVYCRRYTNDPGGSITLAIGIKPDLPYWLMTTMPSPSFQSRCTRRIK